MTNILVTGSSGFVGQFACFELSRRGFHVCAHTRTPQPWPSYVTPIVSSSFDLLDFSQSALSDISCILHLAGRAHVFFDKTVSPILAYRRVNVIQTLKLAHLAENAGVRRFIYISSIKVNGETSSHEDPFIESSIPNPLDPYSLSKFEAEAELLSFASQSTMEVVILRPPLIYGPGVKGNFKTLITLLSHRVPLPFSTIDFNQRSLISLHNLVDIISLCILHPLAAGRLFLVSDQQDVSTAELLSNLGQALNVPARLFPFPTHAIKSVSILLRKPHLYNSLCGSLVVDSSLVSRILGWKPPISFREGIFHSVNHLSQL